VSTGSCAWLELFTLFQSVNNSEHEKLNWWLYFLADLNLKIKVLSMQNLIAFILLSSVIFSDLFANSAYKPKLVNSKSGEHHDFPLGVLEATGRLKDGDRKILIMDVGVDGLAHRAGLQAGDRITKIESKIPDQFSKKTDTGLAGPQDLLGRSLDRKAAASNEPLLIEILRGEQSQQLKISLPKCRSFSFSNPQLCLKRKEYLSGIAEQLVNTQQSNGRWKPGVGGDADVYTTAFCGLVLLANNNPTHLPSIRKAIEFVKKASIATIDTEDPKKGPKNWQTAMNGIFLAEYQLATGDAKYFEDLKKCCDLLVQRVTEKGTMGHHFSIPYSGGGLIVINVQAHLAWALAEKCGYPINEKTWANSFSEVKKSRDPKTGALGYSSRAPWSPDISARTGGMVTALMVSGREGKYANALADSLFHLNGRMRHAHAMSSIGLIFGFSGIKTGAPQRYAELMQTWIPYLELSRLPDEGAAFFGGKRNIGGDQYLGYSSIGNAMVGLVLASADDRLFMHGGKKEGWFGRGK